MCICYLHSCIEPLTKGVKDGAAFIQFEGGGVFTEVLGNSTVEGAQLPDEAFHIGQFGLGPLGNNKKGFRLQKAAAWTRWRREETFTIRKVPISCRKPR